jgi:type I restriction-modification system DNA methylase subunit
MDDKTKSTALTTIRALVARFEEQRESYRHSSYKEAQLRREFIDPMWKALGWDMDNEQGFAEQYKEVIHEDAIKLSTSVYSKAPDYCFRIGGVRKFFLEAKKPSVDIAGDPEPAFQLRSYAWSEKLPLSVLTDFEELSVYDTRVKPSAKDKASVARTLAFRFTDYVDKWDEISAIFSKEAVLKGSFDKYAETAKKKRGTTTVDEDFLAQIESWRSELARNIATRNKELTQSELNFAVQMTIDRIVFLRICEDRGIEEYQTLFAASNGEDVYPRLVELFRRADRKYNSGLFHFSQEKGRTAAPDSVTPYLDIDDTVLRDILRSLYYPESPYVFSALPADILGQVYEQFLGKVIRLTAGHQAKVEEKPEVKKAGGVYYTPTYIVDYIVKHTLGPLLEGKTPKQVAGGKDGPIRILDPACGSGTFLLQAYQYLLDWYRDAYEKEGAGKHAKGKSPVLYLARGGIWRLTTGERKRILTTHIFGVDIDYQAAEVTKLSLLLKVLEGESDQTLQRTLQLFQERALPDLDGNIKSGNSLVGPDYFNSQQLSILTKDSSSINAFDWDSEFRVPISTGGFGVVIGNPPWGASFRDDELDYLRNHYRRVIDRMVDSYIYFVDRAIRISRDDAPVGFVVPSTLLNQSDVTALRSLLLERGLSVVVNLGKDVFTRKVLNRSTIFVSRPRTSSAKIAIGDLSALRDSDRIEALSTVSLQAWKEWRATSLADPHRTFFVGANRGPILLERMRSKHAPLRDIVDGSIQRGVSPDQVKAHVLGTDMAKQAGVEKGVLRPSIGGSQIKRYKDWEVDQVIVYTTRETDIEKYPKCLAYLSTFRSSNMCREVSEGKHPWWSLHRPRDSSIFERPKIIGLTTTKSIELAWDPCDRLYVTDAMYVFSLLDGYDPFAVMAIMQSRLFLHFYQLVNQGESRVIPQIKASKLGELPFPDLRKVNTKELTSLVGDLFALNRSRSRAPQEKTALLRKITTVESQVERIVERLYGVSEREAARLTG